MKVLAWAKPGLFLPCPTGLAGLQRGADGFGWLQGQVERLAKKSASGLLPLEEWSIIAASNKEGQSLWLATLRFGVRVGRRAKGMTRDEIFAAFSRSREPVAFLNKQTRQLLGAKTRSVLSSEAYFIDHAVNHHSEMQPKEFLKMQEVLESPDEIVKDTKGDINGVTFGFIKNDGDKKLVVFLRKDGDTFIFYRTMYLQTGRLSSRYQKISLAKSQGLYRPGTGTSRYESSRSPASSPLISGLVGKDTLPQTSGDVNKNPKKSVKKSAKSKKWIWIDSNGKIWIRKSVADAFWQGMAE